MKRRTYAELAAEGVHALWVRRKFSQKALAEAAGIPQSSVNRIMKGTQPVTLNVLQAVGELAGVNPLEMLLDPTSGIKLVTPSEAALLRYARTWPQATLNALLTFLEFYADEPPADLQLRKAHAYLRDMGATAVRDRAVAYLLFLREGGLSPDVRVALGLPETDVTLRPARRPRKKPTTELP